MATKLIFIHGMFLTAKSWNHWIEYFNALGYRCEAPPWPLHDGEPADLRENVPVGLGKLSLADLHEHYRTILRAESGPPVIIGHSIGGLLVQMLIADGLASAGVAICPVAPNRMLSLELRFLRGSDTIANSTAGDDPYEMTPERFHRNFGSTLSEDSSTRAHARYAVHGSRRVLRDIIDGEAQIDFVAPHAPLLLVGADEDVIIPSSLVRLNAGNYRHEGSHHDYTGFSGHGHYICGEPGWADVAARIVVWLDAHRGAGAPIRAEAPMAL